MLFSWPTRLIRLSGLIVLLLLTLPACSRLPPTTTPPASSPPPTFSLIPPVLMGTPIPIPNEPITPDNVDRIQQLAMWGRGAAKHAAFSPDGQTLAIGTTAGVWLHDTKTLELRRFMLTDEEVTAMAFLADGQLIAQVGGKTINRWDVTTGALVGSWQINVDFLEGVNFTPDGTQLAAPFKVSGAQIGVWDIQSGQLINTLKRQPRPEFFVSRLAFSSDGTLLASAMAPNVQNAPQLASALNNAVEVWNVKTGALLHTLPLPDKEEMSNIIFSPNGKLLAAASGKNIFIWQVETGALLHTLKGHTAIVARGGGLSFSSNGQQLISVGFDQTIRLWSVEEGKLQQTQMDPDLSMIYLAFSADGASLTTIGEKAIRLWDTATGTLLGEVEGYAEGVSDLAVAADGTLYTAQPNNLDIRRWDISTGQIIRRFPRQAISHHNVKLAVSANGQILAAGQYAPNPSVLVWDAVTGQPLPTLKEYIQLVDSLALSPDGSLAAYSNEMLILLNETETGQQLYRLYGGKRPNLVSHLAFSPDGLELVSGGEYCQISVFAVKTGTLLFTLGQGMPAFSPDGTIIATGDPEGQISLWNSETGDMLRPLAQQKSPVTGLAFSADGRLLASAAMDQTIHLWEVETGRLLQVLEGIPLAGNVMFFSNDTMLFSISQDNTIRFWGIPPK